MLPKIFITLLTTTLVSLFTYPVNLSRTVAQETQETQKTFMAQSASQVEVQDIKGFQGVIVAVEVSPDGQTLVVSSNDGETSVIDLENLETLFSVPVKANPYSDVVFSPDGKLFAIASKEDVFLYSTETGRLVRTLDKHRNNISDVAISPDNRTLVSISAADGNIKIWDLETGRVMEEIGEDVGPVTSVAFSPDAKMFMTGAIGADRTIKFWDAETFELIATSKQQPGYIYSVGVTPDGKRFVAGVRNFIKVWDVETGEEKLNLKGPQLELNKVVISPDNRLVATANREGTIMIIDINRGQILSTLRGHNGWVQSVAFSPDGKTLYSGAEDKIVKIWDLSQL